MGKSTPTTIKYRGRLYTKTAAAPASVPAANLARFAIEMICQTIGVDPTKAKADGDCRKAAAVLVAAIKRLYRLKD